MKLELEKLEKSLSEYEEKKKAKERELKRLRELWNKVKSLAEKVDQAVNKMQTSHSNITQVETSLKKLYDQIKLQDPPLFSQLTELKNEAEKSDDISIEKQIIEVLNKKIREIKQDETKISGLEEERGGLEQEKQTFFAKKYALENEIGKFDSQIKRIEEFIRGKEKLEEIKCELCGSQLKPSEYGTHLSEIHTQRKRTNQALNKVKASLEKVKKEIVKLDEEIKRINQLINKKNALAPLIDPINDQLEQKLTFTSELLNEREKLVRLLEKLKEAFREEVPLEKLKEKVDNIKTLVDTLPVEIKGIQDNIERISKEQLPKTIKEVKKRKRANEEIKQLELENERFNRKIDFLIRQVRPALNDIQPLIRRLFIDNINQRASMYFDKFYGKESKYKRDDIRNIWMDDEYRFWVDRLGHAKQATRLSGGQGIVVSLCFLFALLDELGSSLGFLLLDEPSEHLDDKRVEELIEVLKGLQNIPQLIVVDHKPELKETADIKYEVTLENGFSQIKRIV